MASCQLRGKQCSASTSSGAKLCGEAGARLQFLVCCGEHLQQNGAQQPFSLPLTSQPTTQLSPQVGSLVNTGRPYKFLKRVIRGLCGGERYMVSAATCQVSSCVSCWVVDRRHRKQQHLCHSTCFPLPHPWLSVGTHTMSHSAKHSASGSCHVAISCCMGAGRT